MFIPLSALAQDESLSELGERLDKENKEKAQQIQQGESPQSSFEKTNCLPWQIEKAVSGGGIICVDSGEPLTFDDNVGYIVIGAIVVIIIIAIAIRSTKGETPRERRHFSTAVKEQVLKNQGHRCNDCKRLLDVVDYDHIDGDRSNNDISNCQAICPNCHAKKSRKSQMGVD